MKSVAAILLLALIACQKPEESTKLSKISSVRETPVGFIDETGVRDLVRNRGGRALFVNVWATWCVPCVEEFPDIVRLSREYKDAGVDFVGITVDDSSDVQTKVIPFLRAKGVEFKTYVSGCRSEEALFTSLVQRWDSGSWAVPSTLLFDASGNQRTLLIGNQPYERFKAELEKIRKKA